MLRLLISVVLLLVYHNGQTQTIQITNGSAGAGRLHATVTTLTDKSPVFAMGQSNQRGVDDITTLPIADRDSADLLKTYVWASGVGGTLRKVFPRNVSPIRRTQDSILVGTQTSYQYYLPQINPGFFMAEWHRGGAGFVTYPSGAGGYFNATVSSSHDFDGFMDAVLALPNVNIKQGAIIWSQGENEMEDASPTNASNYASSFTSFAADIRSYLGYKVPIFIIEMHNYPAAVNYATMIAQQAEMAVKAGNCYVVSTAGLAPTNVHYTYAEHLILSSRLAESMATYHNRPKILNL